MNRPSPLDFLVGNALVFLAGIIGTVMSFDHYVAQNGSILFLFGFGLFTIRSYNSMARVHAWRDWSRRWDEAQGVSHEVRALPAMLRWPLRAIQAALWLVLLFLVTSFLSGLFGFEDPITHLAQFLASLPTPVREPTAWVIAHALPISAVMVAGIGVLLMTRWFAKASRRRGHDPRPSEDAGEKWEGTVQVVVKLPHQP